MAGAFSMWQPLYEEAGIATFPVDATHKRPSVGNYHRAGLPASRGWAQKFGEADALGFNCGKRNGLTVLDIDAPDEKLLADSLGKFGPSPVVIRTASGKFHVWYKHNGEGRKIRPEKHVPIDILGGGYAVAPPSSTGTGQYEFIEGSLNDLALLRPMLLPVVANDAKAPAAPLSDTLAGVGERNASLWRSAMLSARSAGSYEILLQQVVQANAQRNNPPLPSDEVIRIAASAWAKQQDGSNWIGSGRRVVKNFDEIDAFIPRDGVPHKSAPDAAFLLDLLRRVHYGRDSFVVANAMHERLGWSRKRFTAARRYLEAMGKLRVIKPRSNLAPAVYGF
jgi:hypothetical protein